MGGMAWAPLLRLSGITLVMLSVGIVDGVYAPMNFMLGFLVVETLILGTCTWFLARAILGLVQRLAGERFQAPTIVVVGVALLALSLFPIYTTPVSSTSDQSNVFELLD